MSRGGDMSDMRSLLPTETVLPLIEGAVRSAADESLPSALVDPITGAVMAEVAAGTPLEGTAMMDKLRSQIPPEAMADPQQGASLGKQFARFGRTVGENISAAFAQVGEAMGDAISRAFVDAMRTTFRIASFVLAIGALLALFLKPGRNDKPAPSGGGMH